MFTCSRMVIETDYRHSPTWNVYHPLPPSLPLFIQFNASAALLCGLHFQTRRGQHPSQHGGAWRSCWHRIPERSVLNDSDGFFHTTSAYQRKQGASVDPDPSPSLGLKTFESPGAASNQEQEPETTPEAKKEPTGKDRTCWLINVFVLQQETELELFPCCGLLVYHVPSSF